jgi:hypothetical protein
VVVINGNPLQDYRDIARVEQVYVDGKRLI